MNNWDDYRYFRELSRLGSLSMAAQALGVDQSTVFRRLRSLEEYLGTQVFDRRHHGKYELTEAGANLLIQVKQIEEAAFNIDREILGQDLKLSGTIRVTTAEDIAVVLLPQHLFEFKKLYPEITIELLTENRFFSLERGEADVAIRPVESSTEPRVIPKKIGKMPFGYFASHAYLEKAGVPQFKSDLVNHQVIDWTGNITVSGFIDRQAASIESDSLLVHCAMVKSGMGIGFLPLYLGNQDGSLLQILAGDQFDFEFLWILIHEDLRHSARVRAFVNYMITSLRDEPMLKAG